MKFKDEFDSLVQHSYFLRSSMSLAYDRSQQLENTMQGLELSSIPTDDEAFSQLQVQAAKEIGGVNTRMLLDAPQEVQRYHFGPLQIALSLLFATFEKYGQLSRTHSVFRDDTIDQFCHENHLFVENLRALRNSIVRQRPDNIDEQKRFVDEFSGEESAHMVTLLIEAERLFKGYLTRVWHLLNKGAEE